MKNLTTEKVIFGLIVLATFLIAPFLTTEFLSGNTLPVIFIFCLGLIFALRDQLWILIALCLPLTGSLNILPVKFSPLELSILINLAYVLLKFIFTERRLIRLGPKEIYLPLLLIASILLYHWGSGGDLGLNMLGGQSSGGRRFFSILLGMLALPALLYFPLEKSPWLSRVPLLYLLGSLIEFIPFVVSSFAPSYAPYIYRFYSSVNLETYANSVSFIENPLVRISQVGGVCLALQLVLFCYFPPRNWLRPTRWFVVPLSILLFLATAWSGFRSGLFNYVVAAGTALFLRSRWLVLLSFPLIGALLAFLVFGQGDLFHLPLTIQRALSPFPGKWNREVVMSAESSNDFRSNIQKVYVAEFMDKAGWLGNGYKFDSQYMADREGAIGTVMLEASGDAQARSYITARDHHVGWVAVHHVTGWIGSGAFVLLCLGCLFYVWPHVLRPHSGDVPPEQVWAVALITQSILGFFTVFGALHNFIPPLCVFLAVAIQSFRVDRTTTASSNNDFPAEKSFLDQPEDFA
jgi:hypothetical protein